QTLLKKIELNSGKQTVSEMLNYEENNRSITVMQFLRNIVVIQDGDENKIAVVQVLFDFNRIYKKARETLFIVGGLILLLCFLLIGILYLPISGTYKRLHEGLEEVTRNNFRFSLYSGTRDEKSILYRSFNRMNQHLHDYFKKNQDSHMVALQEVDGNKMNPSRNLLRKTEITCLCAKIPDIQEVIQKNTSNDVDVYIRDFIEPFEKTLQEYGGQIVQIMGDKVYTMFEGINSMDNSVRMALKITQGWQIANHERKVLNRKLKNYGIGLHSAEGIAGSLSGMSASYTFIGEAARVAEKLCSSAQMEEILISSSMMDNTSGVYQHQIVNPFATEDLVINGEIISITALAIDKMIDNPLLKNDSNTWRTDDRLAGSQSITGQPKSSFESSITDMLEETLITAPLAPIKNENTTVESDPKNSFSDLGTAEEEFGDVSNSLWETFDTVKKEGN
ncbi:MAG: hypothetical protein HQ517_06985, partial [SAR324 cluster bacterium]|nr:hypothetical protein [SAR324 cluster bacterium]